MMDSEKSKDMLKAQPRKQQDLLSAASPFAWGLFVKKFVPGDGTGSFQENKSLCTWPWVLTAEPALSPYTCLQRPLGSGHSRAKPFAGSGERKMDPSGNELLLCNPCSLNPNKCIQRMLLPGPDTPGLMSSAMSLGLCWTSTQAVLSSWHPKTGKGHLACSLSACLNFRLSSLPCVTFFEYFQ